jgi:hypothetical protein
MKSILLIGNCGSGKTWVMKKLIEKFSANTLGKIKTILFHKNGTGEIHILGKYDGTVFEGSDKLSMAVMKDLPDFKKYKQLMGGWTICEGDRFTNQTFITQMKPIIIHIVDDGSKGRAKRQSNQTERQIKSIATRVSNISRSAKHQVLNSTEALKVIAEYLQP